MEKVFDQLIELALREDLEPSGDLTTSLIFNDLNQRVKLAVFSRKQSGVFSGSKFVSRVFEILSPERPVKLDFLLKDGENFNQEQKLLEIIGAPEIILQGERLFLNLLQRAISIATLTNQFCKEIEDTKAQILDTRKTTPGLRELEKQAVLDGGGRNHRFNLSTGILIKDNHIALADDLENLLKIVFSEPKQRATPYLINLAIEVDSIEQFERVIEYPFQVVLLDNFSLEKLKEAVKLKNLKKKEPLYLEASGGVKLNNVLEIAKTGVDFISVGKLTQAPELIDLGLDFI